MGQRLVAAVTIINLCFDSSGTYILSGYRQDSNEIYQFRNFKEVSNIKLVLTLHPLMQSTITEFTKHVTINTLGDITK
jgi:hypothetical protein